VSKKLGRVEGLLLITIYIMYIGSALI